MAGQLELSHLLVTDSVLCRAHAVAVMCEALHSAEAKIESQGVLQGLQGNE